MQRWPFDPLSFFCSALAVLVRLGCLAGLVGLPGCGQSSRAVDSLALVEALATSDHCAIGVPDQATLERVRERLARQAPSRWKYKLTLEARRESSPPRAPRFWIGTPQSTGAEAALQRLGVECSERGFRFQGRDYSGLGDGLIATVIDPERSGAILSLVLAVDLEQGLHWIRDWTPTSRLSFQVYGGGSVLREGAVDPSGEASAIDVLELASLDPELDPKRESGERAEFDWSASAAFDADLEANWLHSLDRACAAARLRLGTLTPIDAHWRLMLRLFDTPEELARISRTHDWAALRRSEPQAELSLVHRPGRPDNGPFELARAATLVSVGEPRAAWLLDATAALSAGEWFARPRAQWLAHLWNGGLTPSVTQLVSADGALSAHVAQPMRGALLACLEELHGADFAARHWSSAAEGIALPSEDEFRAWLERSVDAELAPNLQLRDRRRADARERPARRGACVVPSPGRPDPFAGGLGSRTCEGSLEQLSKLGASAVALSWCTAIATSEPRVFGAGAGAWTSAEDPALFATILHARELGMEVTLLPQLVASENGGWASQVMLTTPRTQRELFHSWRRFVTNVGLLAELAGVDVLSLGTEAPDTVVTRKSQGNRRSELELEGLRLDWRVLIQAGRAAFGGGLTYAARWDGEAQGAEFWGELDFLGQNVFPRLEPGTTGAAPSVEEFTDRIMGNLAHLKQLSAQYGVRPLICGIGLSSSADGWRQMSRPAGALDLEVQRRFYAGMSRALQAARTQELSPAGFFTWCWWSDPASGGDLDRGFTPQNKPAVSSFARALEVR